MSNIYLNCSGFEFEYDLKITYDEHIKQTNEFDNNFDAIFAIVPVLIARHIKHKYKQSFCLPCHIHIFFFLQWYVFFVYYLLFYNIAHLPSSSSIPDTVLNGSFVKCADKLT